MKVLLVSTNRLAAPFPVYPLGLDHVAGALAGRHEVRVLDMGAAGHDGALAAVLRDFRPAVVGLSVRNVDNTDVSGPVGFLDALRRDVEAVRRVSPARVVLGGSGFGIFPTELLAATGADGGLVGEGERFGAVLEAWERGEDGARVPGFVLPGRAPVPPEPWDGPCVRASAAAMPHLRYYLDRGGMVGLQSKRGCPHACAYCTYPLLEGRRVRAFAPPEVAAVARGLQDAGARFLFFADATFNIDPEHNLAVADALRGAGVTVPWGAFFAPGAPPDGYFDRLAGAGLTHVEFGTEALSGRTLEAYGKWFGPADVRAAHAAARAAGLHVAHYFLLGGPGESVDTLVETLDGAAALEHCARFFFAGVRIYPGTPLCRRAITEGQIPDQRGLLAPVFYRSVVSAAEILAMLRARARGRLDWVVGSGGELLERVVSRLHARGATGPLWERLIG